MKDIIKSTIGNTCFAFAKDDYVATMEQLGYFYSLNTVVLAGIMTNETTSEQLYNFLEGAVQMKAGLIIIQFGEAVGDELINQPSNTIMNKVYEELERLGYTDMDVYEDRLCYGKF